MKSEYQCPVCGTRNPQAWRSCWYGGCPDGRDKRKWIESVKREVVDEGTRMRVDGLVGTPPEHAKNADLPARHAEALKMLGQISARLGAVEYALRTIITNVESGEWTLPSSFAACARSALERSQTTP